MNKSVLIGIAASLSVCCTGARALDDSQALALMKTAGCAACHSVDKKIVGPAYKDVAAKHKGEGDGAIPVLEKAVRTGSKGVYGPVPMIPTPVAKLSDEDLHALLQWVLSR